MTIEEKRNAVNEYCGSAYCDECLLVGEEHGWEKPCSNKSCPNIIQSPEEDLDKALKIIGKDAPTVTDGYNAEIVMCDEIHADDPVNHPSHYTQGGIECIDAIKASMTDIEFRGFLKGQVIKYMWRYALKGKPVEDLNKAEFYRKRLVEEIEKVN